MMKKWAWWIPVLGLLFASCRGETAVPATPPPLVIATPSPTTPQTQHPITPSPVHLLTPSPTPTLLPSLTPSALPPPATVEIAGATLSPGFSMIKFADLYRPTALTFDTARRLYATSFDGTVHVLVDQDGDGRSDSDTIFFSGFNTPLGLTFRPGTGDLFVSSNTKISVLRDTNGDLKADEAVNFARDLPVGLHQNDNIKFGPDGWLYIGIGSTCDACQEADSRSASIMRFNPDSGEGEVFATGLRNPYDLVFHPLTGELFATDNGRDDLGMDAPQEELNHIVQGGDYGWPGCWDVLQGPGCTGTRTAVAFFAPHSSANSLDFYTGNQFPAEYQNNIFVAIFGSWLKSGVQTGIMRVQLTPNSITYIGNTSWFVSWSGMPLGLIVGPDGAIYVGDYTNNAIYRISYGP